MIRTEQAPTSQQRDRALLFRITLLMFALGFASLTFLVKTIPSFAIDLKITTAIQMIHDPAFDLLMKAVSWPGFAPQSIIITILISLLIYLMGLRWEGLMALIAYLLANGVNLLAKNLIQRPRPSISVVNVFTALTSYSFPSGHVMFYLGFFGFIGFLIFSIPKPSLKRTLLLIFLGTPVVLIGASRIYLGAHWASDVLGAYLLGTLTLILIIEMYHWGRTRFFVQPPAALTESTENIKHVKES